jgi:hypothetical protein
MKENTNKLIESFKISHLKRQSAFLDVLHNLLITTKPVKKNQVIPETFIIQKAIKESNLDVPTPEIKPEDELEMANKINLFIESSKEFLGSK